MKRRCLKKPAQKAWMSVRNKEWCPSCRAFRRRGHGQRCGDYHERQGWVRLFLQSLKDREERMRRYLGMFLP